MRASPSLAAVALGSITVLAAALVVPHDASACAIARDPARAAPKVAGEEALIVWDEESHVEHFVRSARFADATASFAFLVPTPGRPALGAADDRVFTRLARVYLRPIPARSGDPFLRSRSAAGATDRVTVVEQTRVAGLDATVLSATDPGALATWLREHGYATRPDLDAWLAPYVEQGFHVTAFRYDPARQTELTSSAVRLSFPAERAFYPYSEPADAEPAEGRTLRLSVVAPFRVAAREGTRPWRARVGYAGRPGAIETLLTGVLPGGVRPGEWMTTFDDAPSRRGRADLFFERARRQREVAPSIDTLVLGTR